MADDKKTTEESLKSEEELLKKVEGNMAAAFGEPSPSKEPAVSDDTDTPPEPKTEEPKVEDEKPADDPKPDKTDSEKDAGDKDDKDILLPDAYRRTAINQGWTKEEIDEEFKANPERALRTMERIHDSTNNLNAQFATIGQKSFQKPAEKDPVKTEKVEKPATKVVSADLTKLEEAYKDDPIVDIVKGLYAKVDSQSDELSELRQKQDAPVPVSKADQDVATKSIVDFFKGDGLKSYGDFYGTSEGVNWGDLTQIQFAHRQKVISVADQIAAGKLIQTGAEISNAEALEAAHSMVSSEFTKSAITNKLRETLKKRSDQITFEPDKQSRQEDEKAKPKTKEGAIKNAAERMAKIGL